MRYTNHTFLPQPIFDAVTNDPYDKGDADYSVTGLMTPPRISALTERHRDEIVEDAADRIWSLLGQSIHTILERAERTALAEERLYATIGGKRISGKFDRFVILDGILQDYKVTSVYKAMRPVSVEFTIQQNAYLWLLRQNGYTPKGSQLIYLLRDWHKPTARRDRGNYPPYGVVVQGVEVWGNSTIEAALLQRIHLQTQARLELPRCTTEERWAKPDTWAVMKSGAERATKIFTDSAEARNYTAGRGGLEIRQRRGENKRCLDYCPVVSFCSQFKSLQADAASTTHEPLSTLDGDTGPKQ